MEQESSKCCSKGQIHSILWSQGVKKPFFQKISWHFPFILWWWWRWWWWWIVIVVWLTDEYFLISMFSYFILGFLKFLILQWLAKRIDLGLCLSKLKLYLLSTNQSQIFSKLLFNILLIFSTAQSWNVISI